jgi:hypothetical protein
MSMSSQGADVAVRRTRQEQLNGFVVPAARGLVTAGALLSGAAALLHAWVISEHFASIAAVVFFALVAFAQGTYAAALLDHGNSRRLLAVGVVGNLAIIGIWLVMHLVDLSNPALPIHLQVEQEAHIETTAVAGLILEIALVAVLGTALAITFQRYRRMLRSALFKA